MKVYLKEYIDPAAVEKLKQHAEIVTDFDEIEEIEGIITRGEEIGRDLISRAKKLKVIGKHGVGLDSIDLKAAKEYGVKVIFTPGCNSRSVAELSVALLLDVCRNVTLAYRKVKEGVEMEIAPKEFTGIELTGKTMGYIGLGQISMEECGILQQGFHMKVIGYDPYILQEVFENRGIAKRQTVEEVLKEADFVHVSVPLNEETRGLIGRNQLKVMNPNGIIVNTSRGGVIDEEGLYEVLRDGKILGAASDVFVEEPVKKDNPLLTLENFIGTPHLGACTREALVRMGNTVVEEVLTVLNGETPRFLVV